MTTTTTTTTKKWKGIKKWFLFVVALLFKCYSIPKENKKRENKQNFQNFDSHPSTSKLLIEIYNIRIIIKLALEAKKKEARFDQP